MSVDILLVWWQETIVNMHGRQMPHTTKYLVRMDVRQERNQAQSSVVPPLGRQAKYTFKAVAVSLPAPGADPKSEPDGFSANLNWHKQLMSHREAFLSCSPPSMWSSALGKVAQEARIPLGGSTFRPVRVKAYFGLCLRLPSPMAHQIK